MHRAALGSRFETLSRSLWQFGMRLPKTGNRVATDSSVCFASRVHQAVKWKVLVSGAVYLACMPLNGER
jgi:hypothetical protein